MVVKRASLGATASPNDSRVSCYTNQSCFPTPFYSEFASKACHGLGYDLAGRRKVVEGQGSLPQCRHWGLAVSLRMRCHSSTSTQRQQLAPWKRLCELPPHSLDTHPLETYHIPSFLLYQPRVPDFAQTPILSPLPSLSLLTIPTRQLDIMTRSRPSASAKRPRTSSSGASSRAPASSVRTGSRNSIGAKMGRLRVAHDHLLQPPKDGHRYVTATGRSLDDGRYTWPLDDEVSHGKPHTKSTKGPQPPANRLPQSRSLNEMVAAYPNFKLEHIYPALRSQAACRVSFIPSSLTLAIIF